MINPIPQPDRCSVSKSAEFRGTLLFLASLFLVTFVLAAAAILLVF